MWIALLWAVATATQCWDRDVCCNSSMIPNYDVYNRTCASSVCTVGECCLAPQNCSDFGDRCGSSFCPSGSSLNSSQSCSGAGCNTSTCCQLNQYCFEVRYSECPFGQLLDTYASCTAPNCNAAACCRPPQTCNEAASIGVVDRYACNTTGHTFAQEANCTDCSVSTCCRLIQTCGEATSKDSYFCDRSNLTISSSNVTCSVPGSCTVAECCSAPANCYDWSYLSIASAGCYPLGLVPNYAYSTSCPCNAPQCCRVPQTCSEANAGNQLGNACGAMQKVFNYYGNCNGSALPCNTTTCCSPASSCYEFNYYITPNPCGLVGRVPAEYATCGNGSAPCNVDVCCRVPTNCNEIYCPGDLRSVYGSCTNCSVATCCRPPTCGEQYYTNCTGGQILNYNKSCVSGTPCDAAFCCEAITSCGQLRGTSLDPCFGLYPTQVINPTVACSPPNCDIRCCKTPSTCAEYNSAGSRCDYSLVPSNTTTQCNGPCDDQECCRQPAACSELPFYSYCPGLTKLNYSRSCPGPGLCTQAICCVPVTRCSEANDLYSYCRSRGQIANSYGNETVATGCCRDPTTCGETSDLIVSGSFCGIYGALNYFTPCSGASCTQQTCCVRPPDCYSTMSVDYGFCSRSGLVFNTSVSGNCSQTPCTVAECCRRPQYCGEVVSNVSHAQSSSNDENPCPGAIFASGQPCTSCGASDCCRGPMTCEEAARARPGLCSAPTFPILDKPCSGATCGPTDCCAQLTKCPGNSSGGGGGGSGGGSDDDPSAFFCYRNSMVPDRDKAGNSCGGNCVAADCCKLPSNCAEGYVLLYTCLDGDFVNANQTCTGAGCNRATCCRQRPAPTYCGEFFYSTSSSSVCGTNYPNFYLYSSPCNGGADCQAKCCRPVIGCMEAYEINGRMCDGVGLPPVEPTTCQGAACTATKCCAAATTCGELQRFNPDTCDAATQVFDEAKAITTCPCTTAKCCRAPATCEEQSRASATFRCQAGQFMIPGQTCSGTCTLVECCTAATVCRELGVSVCTAARPLANASADAKTCPCDATSCCRPYDSCLEAFSIDADGVCSDDFEPDSSKLNALCNGNCATACCKKKDTHAPTQAPTGLPTGAPTTAGCLPFLAHFQNVSRDCANSDFTPDGLCTPLCSKSAAAVFPAFRDSAIALTEFNGCLDALLGTRFSTTVLAYLRDKLHVAGICTGTTASSGYAIVPPVLLLSGMLLL